jgi:hypothetical protein
MGIEHNLREKIKNLKGIPNYDRLIETRESEKEDDEVEQSMEMR